MHTQIVGSIGPQTNVIAHSLKLSGVYFNDVEDSTNIDLFTHNTFFEDYYRPYILEDGSAEIPSEIKKELISFLNQFNFQDSYSANPNDWIVFDLICENITNGRILYVNYDLSEFELEFNLPEISILYENSKKQADFVKQIAENKGWDVVVCEYAEFIKSDKYKKEFFYKLGLKTPENIPTVIQMHHDRYMQILSKKVIDNFVNE